MRQLPFTPWLIIALIFVAGAVTGAALTLGLRPDWAHPPGPQQMRKHWLGHLTERLDLSADQQAKIRPILDDASGQVQSVHRDEVGKISHILEEANAKISPLLTPRQQSAWKELERERQHDFPGHMHSWGGPHEHHEGPPPPDSDMPPPGTTSYRKPPSTPASDVVRHLVTIEFRLEIPIRG